MRYPVRLIGITDDLPGAQSFALAEALPRVRLCRGGALRRRRCDGDKAVVDRYSRPPGSELGDDVVLDLGGGPREYEMIAVLDTFLLGGVFIAESEFLDLAVVTWTRPISWPAARRACPQRSSRLPWTRRGRDVGLEARTVDEVAHDVIATNRTFTDTFALILLLGLGVALVAVVALLLRSARERRPYLAVLRAMGFRRSTVAITVAAEPVGGGGDRRAWPGSPSV